MRTLAIAAILAACNTTDTTETEAAATETVPAETTETETTLTPPVDVVDEEAKRLQRLENTNFDGENENLTAEDNNFEEVE